MTVISIVEAVRARKGTVFIHTAAASQLGQMLVRYCHWADLDMIRKAFEGKGLWLALLAHGFCCCQIQL